MGKIEIADDTVSLSDWEFARYEELRAGDQIKYFGYPGDGSIVRVAGTLDYLTPKGNWKLEEISFTLQKKYPHASVLYRRKKPVIELPQNFGAIVRGKLDDAAQNTYRFVYDGTRWHRELKPTLTLTDKEFLDQYIEHKVVFTGLKYDSDQDWGA